MEGMWLVVGPSSPDERVVRIRGRLHLGRECAGVDDMHRMLVDHPAVSRDHAEIRVELDGPVLVDTSANGTRLNGRRVERGERTPLHDGDRIVVGDTELVFRASEAVMSRVPALGTILAPDVIEAAVLVGDVIGYTRFAESNGPVAAAAATDALFAALRSVVNAHGGAVYDYAGDAILAAWEQIPPGNASADAVRCALAAARAAGERAGSLRLRDPDNNPIRMGWAVTLGPVAFSHPSPGRRAVRGDAVNLAFRISGLAGRDGQPDILVTDDVARFAPDAARYGDLRDVPVKGRTAPARIRAALADG